jgi:hypothetical protein
MQLGGVFPPLVAEEQLRIDLTVRIDIADLTQERRHDRLYTVHGADLPRRVLAPRNRKTIQASLELVVENEHLARFQRRLNLGRAKGRREEDVRRLPTERNATQEHFACAAQLSELGKLLRLHLSGGVIERNEWALREASPYAGGVAQEFLILWYADQKILSLQEGSLWQRRLRRLEDMRQRK